MANARLAKRAWTLVIPIVWSVGCAPAIRRESKHRADPRFDHIVVIYEENHSFDNLYGKWEGVNGIDRADAAHSKQLDQAGSAYTCLLQTDVNVSPASGDGCKTGHESGRFPNAPFLIDDYIASDAKTCPAPGLFAPQGVPKGRSDALPGGCTRDLVHRFYQEQYQIHGGQQNRYVTGSDAAGMTMGFYDTRALPIYAYLHREGHPRYAIADNVFQGAFGGSFLNHQWLIAAAAPVWRDAVQDGPNDLHSVLDANGMSTAYPLYKPTLPVKDSNLTMKCGSGAPEHLACGDFAVNTTQPFYEPFYPETAESRRLPPLSSKTIADRFADKIDWAWYAGGWSNADGDVNAPGWTEGNGPKCTDRAVEKAVYPHCASAMFQFHHQPFDYYAAFAPGTAARKQHLRDEMEFLDALEDSTASCKLKPVSFVKPLGNENEHPGYSSEHAGSRHLVVLLETIAGSACAKDTLVVVTYDEFGGQWDHVPPPGQGGAPGPHDQWGPGTRIPALLISPRLGHRAVVDTTQYDSTSILATIERRWGLEPLGFRDAQVKDFTSVFDASVVIEP